MLLTDKNRQKTIKQSRNFIKVTMPGIQNNSSNKSGQRNGNKNNCSGKKWYRSKGGNNPSKSKTANNQQKARDLKFHLHRTDSSKKAETFEKIKDEIVSRIKRTFSNAMDIAQSIQDGARITYTEPVMAEPTETDPAKLAREGKMIQLKFQIDYEN